MILSELKYAVISAADANNVIAIESFLADSKLLPDEKLELFHFTLKLAATYGYSKIAESVFACPDLTGEIIKSIVPSALRKAARYGHLGVIKVIFRGLEFSLVEQAELVNVITQTDDKEETLFITAARHNQAAVIHELHTQITQLSLLFVGYHFFIHRDQNQKTALMYAMENRIDTDVENAILALWTDCFELSLLVGDEKKSEYLLAGIRLNPKFMFLKIKTELMVAVKNNKIHNFRFLLLQIDKEFPSEKLTILKSAFILAARCGYTDIVEIILTHIDSRPEHIDLFLNEVDEHVGLEDTALIEAARNGHVRVIEIILQALKNELGPIKNSLNRTNAQGETTFIVAARNEHTQVIKLLFKHAQGKLSSQILISKDQDQKTGFAYAIEKSKESSAVQLIFNAWSQALYEAVCASNEKRVIKILDGLPVKAKFDCLRCSVFKSYNLLMIASKNNNLTIVKALLSNLPFPEQIALLDQKNNEGDTAITIAKKMKYHHIESSLVSYIGNRVIKDSVSRSFVALALKYVRFSWNNHIILKEWLNGDPKDHMEEVRKQKMIEVMHDNYTKTQFNALIKRHLTDMVCWRNSLPFADTHILRFFNIVIFNSEYFHKMNLGLDYLDNNVEAYIFNTFALIWVAMHDLREYSADMSIEMQLQEREEALVATCNPFDVLFKVEKFEENPELFSGDIINGWISSLSGLHSNVSACIFNIKKLEVSAKYLLISQFDCKDYTADQLLALRESLKNNAKLTLDVQQILRPKLKAALHTKFDKFIVERFIKQEDINTVIDNTLAGYCFHNKKIHNTIQEKIDSVLGERAASIVPPFIRKRYR